MADKTIPPRVAVDDRFGRLVVEAEDSRYVYPNGKVGDRRWKCLCDCGQTKTVRECTLRSGGTQSCGCLARELSSVRNGRHHMHKTPEYKAWDSLKDRCLNPNTRMWKRYGGRGITVCDRWLGPDGFSNFYADMGPRPSPKHSLDRIDNNGPYAPWNCRWATLNQQASNNSRNVFVDLDGKMVILREAAKRTGIGETVLGIRVRKGITGPDLFKPTRSRRANGTGTARDLERAKRKARICFDAV